MDESNKNTFKKSMIIGAAVILLFVLSMTVLSYGKSNQITGALVGPGSDIISDEIQEVKLSFSNYGYVLEPSTLKKNVPVKMEVDMGSVYGCMKDIVIPSFGVRKFVSEGDNVIEFVPDQTGTFKIACSMNMGRGSFDVIESDGSKSDYVQTESELQAAVPASQGSCAVSTGGCGCAGY